MKDASRCALAGAFVVCAMSASTAQAADSRFREVVFDPHSVLTVPVSRGAATLILLGPDEAISEVGAGLGGDCRKPQEPWCIAAERGGRTIFVKPKSSASAANNLAVVTDRRVHSFKFVVLADGASEPPVYVLTVKPPPAPPTTTALPHPRLPLLPPTPPLPAPAQIVSERLEARASVMNTQYSIAQGKDSDDIVPTLVFDDGRFTYLRFPGNREVPAVFHILGDGSEALANTRMEDDLLVVDRVTRRLMLRAGTAAIGVWNDAFDLEGHPPIDGTTVPGVRRLIKAGAHEPAANPGVTP